MNTMLNDLLIDAQTELDAAELPELSAAVGIARLELTRHCAPIEVAGFDPAAIAAVPRDMGGAPTPLRG